MAQLINNCLKFNHLFKLNKFYQAIFKEDCLLCAGNVDAQQVQGLFSQNIPAKTVQPDLNLSFDAICKACLNDLPWHPTSSCPQCGLESDGNICGSCLSNPPDFDATHAVFLYDFPVDAMMVRYKYGDMMHLSHIFGQFLSNKVSLSNLLNHADLIIPMPMHPQRLKERGFNQAHEIAKLLTINYKEKLDFKSVERIKLTPPQASLPLKDRVKNIKGAFQVNTDKLNLIQGKRIAIVDDVMTTGASLNELAKTLKKAGASHVECWVIARTLPHK
jgi:ComF family protein